MKLFNTKKKSDFGKVEYCVRTPDIYPLDIPITVDSLLKLEQRIVALIRRERKIEREKWRGKLKAKQCARVHVEDSRADWRLRHEAGKLLKGLM